MDEYRVEGPPGSGLAFLAKRSFDIKWSGVAPIDVLRIWMSRLGEGHSLVWLPRLFVKTRETNRPVGLFCCLVPALTTWTPPAPLLGKRRRGVLSVFWMTTLRGLKPEACGRFPPSKLGVPVSILAQAPS